MKTVRSLRPKQVRILGREYTITWDEDLGVFGMCDTESGEITVRPGVHPVEEADTVIHEILHAIAFLMNIGLSDKVEENVVRKMATGLTQVFMDNPHLLTYIANAGPAPRRR